MRMKRKFVQALERLLFALSGEKYHSETSLEKSLLAFFNHHQARRSSGEHRDAFRADYYQNLHDNNACFQGNNWLVDDVNQVVHQPGLTVTELGCGNGYFSIEAAPLCKKIYAIDWAVADSLKQLPGNVEFLQRDIVSDEIPPADLACSADFLEHLPEEVLDSTVAKIIRAAPKGFHKIACYDDGHSHLSIFPASFWLNLFQKFDNSYQIKSIEFRRHRIEQQVITLANY